MCVHLFGGISSQSCSNYALKRTSVDNEKKFGSDAARTLRRNFYVDGMLKSSRGIDEAVDLIQRIRNICKAGEFILTKFVKQQDWSDEINSRGTLQKNHQHQRARKLRSTKGKSIRSSIEHQNRYIWIQDIEDKPATEIGMLSELSSVYNPLGLASPFILKGRRITQKLCQGIAWDCCYTLC